MSTPELLQRWLIGPPGWEMTLCENDLSVGGEFRHVWRFADGTEMAMRGVYREIAYLSGSSAPKRSSLAALLRRANKSRLPASSK